MNSVRISTSVGEEGTSAILGFDHNLIQLSSYINKSLALVRGCNLGNERSLLARVQRENNGITSFGWGLDLDLSPRETIQRGFVRCQWPICMSIQDPIARRSSTYVKDGSLIQVMALISLESFLFTCSIGGKIQLLRRSFDGVEKASKYDVNISPDGHVLSASCSCENLTYCVDVELFRNGRRLNPKNKRSEPNNLAADITWIHDDNIRPRDSVVFVARFTLREEGQVLDHSAAPPEWEEVKSHLGFGSEPWRLSTAWNLWTAEPEENAKIQPLTQKILPTIARNVEQLLSVAALPHDHVKEPDAKEVFLINSLVGDDELKLDYEACL